MAKVKKTLPVKNPPPVKIITTPSLPTPNDVNIILSWIIKITVSILILYISYIIATRTSKLIVMELKKNVIQHKKLIVYQLSEIIFYIVFGLGILVALINLGVQTATIITLMGTMVVTVGLALQNILSNIFAGIYVALADNFRIGDVIRVYVPFISHPIEGQVEDLNITYAILREVKTNQVFYIPNTSISGNVVVNISRTNK